MPKKTFIYILLLLSVSFFPLCILQDEIPENMEEQNYTEEDNTTYDEYNATDYEYEDPLKNLNFTNVLLYDDSNYTLLEKSELTFALFYSEYCHHCHQFMPTFIETADYCKEQNLKVTFARVDANTNTNASEAFGIESYPTVYLILKGKRFLFNGIRTKEALLNFMNKKLNDDIYKINKLEEVNNHLNKTSIVLLSTIKDKSSKIFKSFYDFAKQNNDFEFLSCLSDECLKKYGEDVILFKTFDEKELSYNKDYVKISGTRNNSVYDFISIFGIETGAFLSIPQIDLLIQFNRTALIYIRNSSNEEDTKYDSLFKKLGKELRFENVYCYVSDTGETYDTNIGEAFSVLPNEIPGVFIYQQNTGDPSASVKIFSLRNLDMKKVSIDYLKKFVKDVRDGKVRRDLFSEDPSESQIIDGMRYVVGKTFDKYVTDEKKNVFLGVVESVDYKEEDKLFLDILRNLTKKYQDLSFTYINVQRNEPRDLLLRENEIPVGFLYTNAMEKKEIIRFEPKNFSDIREDEIVEFLDKNLKIDRTKQKEGKYQTDL